jgi:hypothetical protein
MALKEGKCILHFSSANESNPEQNLICGKRIWITFDMKYVS